MAIKPLTKTQLRDWIRTGIYNAGPPVELIPEPDDGDPDKHKWYVATTEPQREKLAQSELVDRGFGTYLPQYRLERLLKRKGKRIIVQRVLFPRYVFVKAPDYGAYSRILAAKGVESIVMGRLSGQPLVIPANVIQILLDRQNGGLFDNMMRAKDAPFQPGQLVLVTKGAFFSFQATVIQALAGKHVDVELSIFGGDHHLSIPIEHLEAV